MSMLCEFCGEGTLFWVESESDGGYLCENWSSCDQGVDCARLVSEEDYNCKLKEAKERKDDEVLADMSPGTVETLTQSDSPKNANIEALKSGKLVVKRQSLLPKVLSVSETDPVIRRQFKSPIPGASSTKSKELVKRLQEYKKFVPWGSRTPLGPLSLNGIQAPEVIEKTDAVELPPGIEPLVLWQPEDDPMHACDTSKAIIVDPHLTRFLRPHQREGVQFMFECVAGLRDFSEPNEDGDICSGCILADDMGLGKTLQSITLLWTLLVHGFNGTPMVKRAVVVTPTSLVSNWEAEIKKWLGDRVKVIGLCESTRENVMLGITNFLAPRSPFRVLIISYETFRIHAKRLQQKGCCDLLICDEAHRLKNDKTLTNQALAGLSCRRRVLLSGTPMQNDLEEFFAMVNFTNPGVLGDAAAFRRYYEVPIVAGREPEATDSERALGAERSEELSHKVNQFILRRTNTLLSNHLPPKIVQVVCCRMTDLQFSLYRHFVTSKKVKRALEDSSKRSQVLASITALKKLCNHPKLIFDAVKSSTSSEASGFEDCLHLFPPSVLSARNGAWTGGEGLWVELSGKMSVLARLLHLLRKNTRDRIVLVSNYTQTLDLFSQLCRERSYPFIRLDGSTGISKRQKLVQKFNDPNLDEFAFLLSSKAGGCGLNLIGGNRLVLFDPDWNPANDKQAAARVWRDGQKKRVYIYRFLATGTIEEKVYQRQMSKEGLQKVVDSEKTSEKSKPQVNLLSAEDLRDLFTLRDSTLSDTHDTLTCKRCTGNQTEEHETHGDKGAETEAGGVGVLELDSSRANNEAAGDCSDIGNFAHVSGLSGKLKLSEQQVGSPTEEQLQFWGHHTSAATVPDVIMQQAGKDLVSFVFSCQVDGKLVPQEGNEPGCNKGPLGGVPGFKGPSRIPRSGPLVRRSVAGACQLSKVILPSAKSAAADEIPKNISLKRKSEGAASVVELKGADEELENLRLESKGVEEFNLNLLPHESPSFQAVKKQRTTTLMKAASKIKQFVASKGIANAEEIQAERLPSERKDGRPVTAKEESVADAVKARKADDGVRVDGAKPRSDEFSENWAAGLVALESDESEDGSEDSEDSDFNGGDDETDDE